MHLQPDTMLTFIEDFTEKLVLQTDCDFLFEGVCVESNDVASSRGLLPVIMNVVHLQENACKSVLSDTTCDFLYGWTKALKTVDDADTLTGKRLTWHDDSLTTEICWYTMCASLVTAVAFMESCSDTPQAIHFDTFKEEYLHADNEGIQPE